jgi:hypothetical protein
MEYLPLFDLNRPDLNKAYHGNRHQSQQTRHQITQSEAKMSGHHFRKLVFVCMVCIVFSTLSACHGLSSTKFTDEAEGTYPVDSLFRELYQDLGGKERFGPAISEKFDRDKQPCQYTVNALLCHNPLATGAARYYLAPLGKNLILTDDTSLVNNAIYPDFVPLFNELNQFDAVGSILTGVHYNYEQQRVEQYFEKIGLYHRFDDPHGTVYLLPYGEYFCGSDCSYQGVGQEKKLNPQYPDVTSPFGTSLDRLGGMQIFGRPLTHPYETEEGTLEQVYENIVVFAPLDNLSALRLKPLPRLLGLTSTSPAAKVYGAEQNMVFYATSGELGYHVPIIFDYFIMIHGGLEISGNPIADPYSDPESGVPRQCYENYCLDYHSEAEKEYQTRMAPLGTRYLKEILGTNATMTRYVYSNETVSMQVSEAKPQIPSTEEQIIDLVLIQRESQSPIANIESKITLTFPDGQQDSLIMSPTNPQGKTTLTIPAYPDLKTGDLVTYKICLNVPSDSPICLHDSYLIWNYP